MPKEQIELAIEDRLCRRWKERCLEENAAPVFILAIKQLAGPGYGRPVLVTTEDISDKMLADFLRGAWRAVQRGDVEVR
jgi:hypothetical protein